MPNNTSEKTTTFFRCVVKQRTEAVSETAAVPRPGSGLCGAGHPPRRATVRTASCWLSTITTGHVPVMAVSVEEVSSSLVREYLSRKVSYIG